MGTQITETFIYLIAIVSLGENMGKCGCGCGQEVTKRFVRGHNMKLREYYFANLIAKHFSGSVKGKRPDVAERNRINNKLHVGEKAYHWKGGMPQRDTYSEKYKAWRKAVFERDNFTCQKCGKRGCKLEAHHIKEWADFPELRYDVDNGQTLCKKCHNLTKIKCGYIMVKEKK